MTTTTKKKASRGRHEGSIRQRTDGTWEARFTVNKKRKSAYAATKQEALKELDRLRLEAGKGFSEGAEMLLRDYLDSWLRTVVKPKTEYTTWYSYEMTVRNHIVPHVGHLKLKDITPGTLLGLEEALRAKTVKVKRRPPGASKRSPAVWVEVPVKTPTIYYARTVFRLAINAAKANRIINENPFKEMRLAQYEPAERPTWKLEHVQKFFAAAADHWFLGAFVTLALTEGLRHGEMLGLTWPQIDFKARTISVEQQLARGEDGPIIKDVKTKASHATIRLTETCAAALIRHREKMLAYGIRSKFVFVTHNETLFSKNNVNKAFKALIKSINLPRINIHDLRHTCATVLLEDGVEMKEIQALLRHAKYAITADIYGHVTTKMKVATAAKMDELMGSAK